MKLDIKEKYVKDAIYYLAFFTKHRHSKGKKLRYAAKTSKTTSH